MRKHAVNTLQYSVTSVKEFTTTIHPKKEAKTTSLSQQTLGMKPRHTSHSSAKIKSLTWDAYKNELEFE
jgi:hypothetical protein